MSILPARYSPYLLYRVEIRRVRRQFDKEYACRNVGILLSMVLTNQTPGFLMPWYIVHDKGILLPFRGGPQYSDSFSNCLRPA